MKTSSRLFILTVNSNSTHIFHSIAHLTKKLFYDILENWKGIQDTISGFDDKTTVLFTEFQKLQSYNSNGEAFMDKKGKLLKRLTVVKCHVNANYLVKFLDNLLPEIIFHRNTLKLYRNTIKEFDILFPSVHLDVEFSENLTLDIKFESQCLHWIKKQVTMHSGILKCQGVKYYHPYISDNKGHDQSFFKVVLEEMLDSIRLQSETNIMVESDSCSGQYMSAKHFYNLRHIADKYMKEVISVYGIAGQGKGEVDHVGGVVKVAVCQEIARGSYFSNTAETVAFLKEKFSKSELSAQYNIKEILSEDVECFRKEVLRKNFKTIQGSPEFHVAIFRPGNTKFKASHRYCVCQKCQLGLGSCDLFKEYEIVVKNIIPSVWRSEKLKPVQHEVESEADEFITPGAIIAVSLAKKSDYTVWFICVADTKCCSKNPSTDDYGHIIPPGINFLQGNVLERVSSSKLYILFKCSKKITYFY